MASSVGLTTSVIALETSDWDTFYSSWVKPIVQLLIPLAIALAVLIAVSGLVTRFMVRQNTEAWSRTTRWIWAIIGGLSLFAVAAFLPIYPMFHPFADGTWPTWAFLIFVVAPGVTLAGLALRHGLPQPTFWLLMLVWAALVSCFFSWGESHRLLVAYIALAVLGITATATALGQNLRLQVEAQAADGTADAAASAYVLARLQALGSKQPDALGISRASELSKLLKEEDLSAIPAGSIAAAVARVMYAISPGLTWRARLTMVDVNRATVTLTRNGLHVQSTVISRTNLSLPPLTSDVQPPQLEEEEGRARAQLLTGAAACILVQLSRAHPDLKVGLCGAEQWKSIALHVIATEPALMDDPEIQLKLLRSAVNVDREYGLARFDYLVQLFTRTSKTTADRMRFARLMDAQLPLSEAGQAAKSGWESIHMRILYSRAAMRVNCYLMAMSVSNKRADQVRREEGNDILEVANDSLTRLITECTSLKTHESEQVSQLARYMKPVAENLQSAIAFLIDEARRRAKGGNWTWTAPEPVPHPSPKLAGHYASLAGLADEYGVTRGRLGDTLDYLAFAVATCQDRQELRSDPSFWKLLHDPERAALVEDALSLKQVGMLDLRPFRPYADALTAAGITTFEQFRLRTSTKARRDAMSSYLATATVVVSHLTDIAELAATHDDLARAEVLRVFLDAGITSRDDLRRQLRTDRNALLSALRADAERRGLSSLDAFTAPGGWLGAL